MYTALLIPLSPLFPSPLHSLEQCTRPYWYLYPLSFSFSFTFSRAMYTALPTTIFCCTPTIKPLYVGCTINLKIGVARVHTLLQIPLWVIYFLDSGGGTYPELVYPDQITWFNKTASDITHTYGPIPALAFFHIPRFASLILPSPTSPPSLFSQSRCSVCG